MAEQGRVGAGGAARCPPRVGRAFSSVTGVWGAKRGLAALRGLPRSGGRRDGSRNGEAGVSLARLGRASRHGTALGAAPRGKPLTEQLRGREPRTMPRVRQRCDRRSPERCRVISAEGWALEYVLLSLGVLDFLTNKSFLVVLRGRNAPCICGGAGPGRRPGDGVRSSRSPWAGFPTPAEF